MSTVESLKRARTLHESAEIIQDHLTRIHDFLFGPQPEQKTDRATRLPDAPIAELPYFMALINIQSRTDESLNRTHDLLSSIADKLEMSGKQAGGIATTQSKSTRSTVDHSQLDKDLTALVDSMKVGASTNSGAVSPRSI